MNRYIDLGIHGFYAVENLKGSLSSNDSNDLSTSLASDDSSDNRYLRARARSSRASGSKIASGTALVDDGSGNSESNEISIFHNLIP